MTTSVSPSIPPGFESQAQPQVVSDVVFSASANWATRESKVMPTLDGKIESIEGCQKKF